MARTVRSAPSTRRRHDHPDAAPRGGVPPDSRQRLLRGGRVRPRHGRTPRRREGRRRGRPTGPCRRELPQGAVLPALRHPARHHHHLARRRHARRTGARRAAARTLHLDRHPRRRRARRRRGRRHVAGLGRTDGDRRTRAQELGGVQADAGRALRRRTAARVRPPVPTGDRRPERRRQPARPCPGRRARRGAGLRPHPRRTRLPGPALGQGGHPGTGHSRPLRTHPLAGRPHRAARHDTA